jgi:hypothetical protein
MFSSLLEFVKVRLFQVTDAHSRFECTRAVYKTFRQSKEEKLFLVLVALVPENISSQYDDENAAYYPA